MLLVVIRQNCCGLQHHEVTRWQQCPSMRCTRSLCFVLPDGSTGIYTKISFCSHQADQYKKMWNWRATAGLQLNCLRIVFAACSCFHFIVNDSIMIGWRFLRRHVKMFKRRHGILQGLSTKLQLQKLCGSVLFCHNPHPQCQDGRNPLLDTT